MSSPVLDEAARIARLFEYPREDVLRGVAEYRKQMEDGLAQDGATLSQIPTFVTEVPTGKEKGLYLAVDLGGTNFRVCSVHLHGDNKFSLTQSKIMIPRELMTASSSKDLFLFLAKQIESFLRIHHTDRLEAQLQSMGGGHECERMDLGFTFSFPVRQYGINKGTLIRWTKGFNIPDAVGCDVCAMLQDAIDELKLPINVAALVNDTVGTLMARAYASPGGVGTLIAAIFGTGTNGAYVEDLSKILKMDVASYPEYHAPDGQMVINTEWGSFDNHLTVLPNTVYDQEVDIDSNNPGIQMFEKRVSGMFLGEILRRALLDMHNNPSVNLLKSSKASGIAVSEDSPLYSMWGIDTSFLSLVEEDKTPGLSKANTALQEYLQVRYPTYDDCKAVQTVVHAIGKRAARLSAVPIAAILISTGRVFTDEVIDIGVDGSLIEFYPHFENYIRDTLREIPEIGTSGEKKIRIAIAKEGSGVGAALIALVAARKKTTQDHKPL